MTNPLCSLSIKLRVSCGQFVLYRCPYRQMSALSVSLLPAATDQTPDTEQRVTLNLLRDPQLLLRTVSSVSNLHNYTNLMTISSRADGRPLQQLGQNPIRPDNTWYKTKKFFIYKIRGELRFSILAPKVWQEFSIRCSKKQFNVHVKTIVFHRQPYYLNSLSNAWPVCLPVYYLPTVHSYLCPPL